MIHPWRTKTFRQHKEYKYSWLSYRIKKSTHRFRKYLQKSINTLRYALIYAMQINFDKISPDALEYTYSWLKIQKKLK